MASFTRACLQLSVLALVLLCTGGLVAGVAMFPQILIFAAIAAVYLGRKGFQGSGWVFGTARVADHRDLIEAGYLGGRWGVLVGRVSAVPKKLVTRLLFSLPRHASERASRLFLGALDKRQQWVRVNQGVHCLVCAPSGKGKGVGIVIPALLTDPGSFVVLDSKGELYLKTAKARRKMGHRVIAIDPMKQVTDDPDTFNPLSAIDVNDVNAVDDVKALASALVKRTGHEQEAHWNDSAEMFIVAVCYVVLSVARAEICNLQSVATILADPAEMKGAKDFVDAHGSGMLKRMWAQLGHYGDKERGSVLTTANRHLSFLNSPSVEASTSATSFEPNDLRKRPTTIYLVIPTDKLQSHAGLLRMWIASLLRVIVKGGAKETGRVTFLLDEAAALGHLQPVDDAIAQLRGYGLRMMMIYQSLGQLKHCYPDGQDQTFLSNIYIQIYF